MESLTTDVEVNTNTKGMSAYSLKMIAIIAMVIDHIAWGFVPTCSFFGQTMHLIGRLTAPIMCFFIAEGYHQTRNIKKYALRLGIFALISHVPFYYFEHGRLPFTANDGFQSFTTSVIYTFFLGLMSLIVWNNENLKETTKILLIVSLCILGIMGDWAFFAILWILLFGIYRGDSKKQIKSFCIVAAFMIILILSSSLFVYNGLWYRNIFHIGVFLAIPFLKLYNGEIGGRKNFKWFFYIFYPLHLLIIGLLSHHLLK